jgi:hypothetical protein
MEVVDLEGESLLQFDWSEIEARLIARVTAAPRVPWRNGELREGPTVDMADEPAAPYFVAWDMGAENEPGEGE